MSLPLTYKDIVQKLSQGGIKSPRLEARMIIAHALHISPDEVSHFLPISKNDSFIIEQSLQRRLTHEPIDKIIGHKDFYQYTFKVTQDVLSPRPDTEILLETALNITKIDNITQVLELGIGSGCVLLSMIKQISTLKGVGVDASQKALEICRQNAENLQVSGRCQLIHKNWFDLDFADIFDTRYDMIVSNPPYIKTQDIENLDDEVRLFDPLIALDGGTDGLKSYRRIAEISPSLLKKGGYIVLEIGLGQEDDVQAIFSKQNFDYTQTLQDLAGINRVLVFKNKS